MSALRAHQLALVPSTGALGASLFTLPSRQRPTHHPLGVEASPSDSPSNGRSRIRLEGGGLAVHGWLTAAASLGWSVEIRC